MRRGFRRRLFLCILMLGEKYEQIEFIYIRIGN